MTGSVIHTQDPEDLIRRLQRDNPVVGGTLAYVPRLHETVFNPLLIPPGLHEWFYEFNAVEQMPGASVSRRSSPLKNMDQSWLPPLAVMSAIAGRAADAQGKIIFIGRICWPTM